MQFHWNLETICEACEGQLLGWDPEQTDFPAIDAIKTDTREDLQGCIFLALVGEKFDGHRFLVQARAAGARAFLLHDSALAEEWSKELPVVLVEDTQTAYGKLARYYRDHRDFRVVAVTGSVGKTSTRDAIATALGADARVHKTQENLNNEIGVPATLLASPPDTELAVIEGGLQYKGDIARFSYACHPDLTVITNVGTSHIEFMGNRLGIMEGKGEIVSSQKDGGPLILNGEDPYLLELARRLGQTRPIYFVSTNGYAQKLHTHLPEDRCLAVADEETLRQAADLASSYTGTYLLPGIPSGSVWYAEEIEETCDRLTFKPILMQSDGQPIHYPQVSLARLGIQQIPNVLFAIACVSLFGLDPKPALAALESMQLTQGRQEILPISQGSLVINDCYNASPESMKAAFHFADVLRKNPRFLRTYAVLAGVNELGEYAGDLHYDMGYSAGTYHFSAYYLLGPWAETLAEGILAADPENQVYTFTEKKDLLQALYNTEAASSIFLVKGSHGYHLEEVCRALAEHDPET